MKQWHLKRVEEFFWENFRERGDLGASLSIWHEGREVLSLAGGYTDKNRQTPWTAETPVLVWSATKGPGAACLLHALERQGESLETPVSVYWPEFAQAGKERVTFGDVLSHRAGVAALDKAVPMLDREAVAEALAVQVPNWPLKVGVGGGAEAEGHGYHPRTFGGLLDELVRRVDGLPIGEYWQTYFATPLGLDFWMGVPASQLERVAPIYAASSTSTAASTRTNDPEDDPFYKAFGDPASLTARAFASPKGLSGVSIMNTPEVRMSTLAGSGGIGTAHALAKFYAMLAEGGALEGIRFFGSTAAMEKVRSRGEDKVLLRPTAFAAGVMHDPVDAAGKKLRSIFGPSVRAFGQPGAGGSHAFADPEHRIAFAYVMNQMEQSVMPNEKALGLVRSLYGVE